MITLWSSEIKKSTYTDFVLILFELIMITLWTSAIQTDAHSDFVLFVCEL